MKSRKTTAIIALILLITLTIQVNTIFANETNQNTKQNTEIQTQNITTYQELSDTMNKIQNTKPSKYQINLKKDNYTLTHQIQWENSNTSLIINGQGSTLDGKHNHTFLKIDPNTRVLLANMTITNTKNNTDAAIYNLGNLTLQNVTIKNCQITGTTLGGGAINNRGNLTINNSNLENNTAINGGAIYNLKGMKTLTLLTINNTNFTNNNATIGSCLYNFQGNEVIIDNCIFEENYANDCIIYANPNSGVLQINNSKIIRNTIQENLIITHAQTKIENTQIHNNTQDTIIKSLKTLKIKNTTITDHITNTIILNMGDLNLEQSQISQNNAKDNAIINNNTMSITNSTLYDNNLGKSLLNSINGIAQLENNKFINNTSNSLFIGTVDTFTKVINNTYRSNKLTNTTLTLETTPNYNNNTYTFNYYDNKIINLTLNTNPVYNTTINTGYIEVKYNNISTKTYVNSSNVLIKLDINSTINFNIRYVDDNNFISSDYKTILLQVNTPSYYINTTGSSAYNFKDYINYHVNIVNNGTSDGYNITIANIIPENVEIINTTENMSENSWKIDKLEIGEVKNLNITLLAKKASNMTITPTINKYQNSTQTLKIQYLTPHYNIKLNTSSVMYGDNIANRIRITNTGYGIGYNLNIRLTFDNHILIWNINEIGVNKTIILNDTTLIQKIGQIKTTIDITDTLKNHQNITTSFEIKKPIIEFRKIITNPASTINITAILHGVNTSKLSGKAVFKLNNKTMPGVVKIKENTVILTNYTVSSGIQYLMNNLSIIYANKNLKVENKTLLQIEKLEVKIKLDDNITITQGKSTKFIIKILDKNNNPVIKGRVVLKINKNSLKDNRSKVIYLDVKDGIAELEYIIPSDFCKKHYRFDVVYGENNMYKIAHSNTTLTTISQNMYVTMSNSTFKRNTKYILYLNLTGNITGLPIHGGNFVVKINGKTMTPKISVKSTQIKVDIDTTLFSSIKSITFCYSGNEVYNPRKVTTNLDETFIGILN